MLCPSSAPRLAKQPLLPQKIGFDSGSAVFWHEFQVGGQSYAGFRNISPFFGFFFIF